MKSDELYDLAAAVGSRQEFVAFIDALRADFHQHNAEWENDDLGSFLGGLSGFAHDMQGFYRNIGEDVDVDTISWRIAAQMLLAATVYGH